MGFPVPGDAIEESLDLNHHLVHNPAATFFMKVEGDAAADASVLPGDLLVVDRSLEAQNQSLVVGVIEGQMVVLRVLKQGQKLIPARNSGKGAVDSLETWGVVTNIIRKVCPLMFAVVDCNSFFASCEKVFRPDLEGKPVAVLSNNDGCIVARSPEAKKIVPM